MKASASVSFNKLPHIFPLPRDVSTESWNSVIHTDEIKSMQKQTNIISLLPYARLDVGNVFMPRAKARTGPRGAVYSWSPRGLLAAQGAGRTSHQDQEAAERKSRRTDRWNIGQEYFG